MFQLNLFSHKNKKNTLVYKNAHIIGNIPSSWRNRDLEANDFSVPHIQVGDCIFDKTIRSYGRSYQHSNIKSHKLDLSNHTNNLQGSTKYQFPQIVNLTSEIFQMYNMKDCDQSLHYY